MSGKKGIKESKEIILAAKSIAIDAIKASNDGISFSDISVILGNLENIKNAVSGCGEVPSELKDLDANEISELVSIAVSMVFEILAALKKDK